MGLFSKKKEGKEKKDKKKEKEKRVLPVEMRKRVVLPPDRNHEAIKTIREAVEAGVPLYNRGDLAGCAKIYMKTSEDLLKEKSLPHEARQALERALRKARHAHHYDTKAWALRYGLDAAYRELNGSMTL